MFFYFVLSFIAVKYLTILQIYNVFQIKWLGIKTTGVDLEKIPGLG